MYTNYSSFATAYDRTAFHGVTPHYSSRARHQKVDLVPGVSLREPFWSKKHLLAGPCGVRVRPQGTRLTCWGSERPVEWKLLALTGHGIQEVVLLCKTLTTSADTPPKWWIRGHSQQSICEMMRFGLTWHSTHWDQYCKREDRFSILQKSRYNLSALCSLGALLRWNYDTRHQSSGTQYPERDAPPIDVAWYVVDYFLPHRRRQIDWHSA